jgi:hypothetical protein
MDEAASMPLVGLTSWQALIEKDVFLKQLLHFIYTFLQSLC